MKWFINLAMRTKLFLGFGLMVVLLALVTATAYRGITTIREDQSRLFEENLTRVFDIMDVQFNQAKIRLNAATELLVTER